MYFTLSFWKWRSLLYHELKMPFSLKRLKFWFLKFLIILKIPDHRNYQYWLQACSKGQKSGGQVVLGGDNVSPLVKGRLPPPCLPPCCMPGLWVDPVPLPKKKVDTWLPWKWMLHYIFTRYNLGSNISYEWTKGQITKKLQISALPPKEWSNQKNKGTCLYKLWAT